MSGPHAQHDHDRAGIERFDALLDRLRRPLLLTVLVSGLIGCNTTPPSTASPPQHVAAAPAANTLDHPPVPKRKPVTPTTQTAAVAPDTATAPDSSVPAETHTAALETAPSTPATLDVPSEIVGMDSSAIEQDLGPPESRRDVPPAVVWQYANDACGLDVWLYRDLQSGALRALFVEVKGDDRTDQRRQFCIKQLALQSAGGTHRADTDPTAAR